MQQRITVSELKELSGQQKNELREWWKPQQYDVVCDIGDQITVLQSTENISPTALPLLSVVFLIN